MLTGPLDGARATEVEAQLIALDAAGHDPITLHVDSADGALPAAFVVMDVIDALAAPVHALCRGQVGGPSLGVVAAAERRIATPHARFRLAQPTTRFSGTPDAIAAQSREQQDLLEREIVAGRELQIGARDTQREREAREVGTADDLCGIDRDRLAIRVADMRRVADRIGRVVRAEGDAPGVGDSPTTNVVSSTHLPTE